VSRCKFVRHFALLHYFRHDSVDELMLSQQDQPQIYRSIHLTAQAGVIWVIFYGDLGLKCKEMYAKELTEAHSCSELLLIDVIFIWLSDIMLFTLNTLKGWRMASGAAKNKTLLSHKNDVQSVVDGDRWRIEIRLRQCAVRRSWSSYWRNLTWFTYHSC